MWNKQDPGLFAEGLRWFIDLDPIENDSHFPPSNGDHKLKVRDASEDLELVPLPTGSPETPTCVGSDHICARCKLTHGGLHETFGCTPFSVGLFF